MSKGSVLDYALLKLTAKELAQARPSKNEDQDRRKRPVEVKVERKEK